MRSMNSGVAGRGRAEAEGVHNLIEPAAALLAALSWRLANPDAVAPSFSDGVTRLPPGRTSKPAWRIDVLAALAQRLGDGLEHSEPED